MVKLQETWVYVLKAGEGGEENQDEQQNAQHSVDFLIEMNFFFVILADVIDLLALVAQLLKYFSIFLEITKRLLVND